MNLPTLPRILSPNLGCPEIVSLERLSDKENPPFKLVVAAKPSGNGLSGEEAPTLKLAPIGTEPKDGVELEICGAIRRIDDWSTLGQLRSLDDTRLLFNKILHYEVLGSETEYFEVQAYLDKKRAEQAALFLRDGPQDGKKLPALCDLIADFTTDSRSSNSLVNRHAVQLVETCDRELNFIHLTDLHLARRNDELLDEILHVSKRRRRKRSPELIRESFINFNDNFRGFIHAANILADEGKLDFVVMSGDLVDFAYHGWEYEANYAENNWRTFIKILTGSGNEKFRTFRGKGGQEVKGNPGLKVAVFTSTGNHDWRLFPYDPGTYGQGKRFGLKDDEIKCFDFKTYDALRHEKKREELAPDIAERHLDRWNLGALKGEYSLKLAKWVATETSKKGVAALSGLLGFVGADTVMSKQTVGQLMRWGIPVLVGGTVGLAVKLAFNAFMNKKIQFLMDNPLRAEPMALHHYLLHVNPYLDYAFTFGKHTFILMDTGTDVITGQLFDGKNLSDLKRLSLNDNVLGGSPDSRAFDSEHLYYNWSQIVWLEKVLLTVEGHNKDRPGERKTEDNPDAPGRTFIFLHAPPLNTKMIDADVAAKLWEKDDPPSPILENVHRLTFGTMNHYVSELLYMCLGYLEREVPQEEKQRKLSGVDIVFSGHAHRCLEFRLKTDENSKGKIRIFSGHYSETQDDLSNDWWYEHRPVLVQTPACGVPGKCNINPPYFRCVKVASDCSIKQFGVEGLMGAAPVQPTCRTDMRLSRELQTPAPST